MSYNSFKFIDGMLAYLKLNLNTKLELNNKENEDELLDLVENDSYLYISDVIEELRANTCVVFNTPATNSISSIGTSSAVTKRWQLGIGFAENKRDMDYKNLEKLLRYEECFQNMIEKYFSRTGHCNPELVGSTNKVEANDENLYRYIIYDINFTIAGT